MENLGAKLLDYAQDNYYLTSKLYDLLEWKWTEFLAYREKNKMDDYYNTFKCEPFLENGKVPLDLIIEQVNKYKASKIVFDTIAEFLVGKDAEGTKQDFDKAFFNRAYNKHAAGIEYNTMDNLLKTCKLFKETAERTTITNFDVHTETYTIEDTKITINAAQKQLLINNKYSYRMSEQDGKIKLERYWLENYPETLEVKTITKLARSYNKIEKIRIAPICNIAKLAVENKKQYEVLTIMLYAYYSGKNYDSILKYAQDIRY